ncbi:hypothetical protein MBM_06320 [Drepanopeziza brunnea f. sp. 'multigermtubi' MB_m1]|uniref:Uncharacterized protein n=1 Tax=Marssonina brunnea f. sp. multigermtubi (strain MB_m1) TaxID=1072389 RepID=K1WTE5_MARBU|nr:uncharacterized protein MBM_06320 [Drepanopeziza brunnea f. sp. 'multigermtubi' MB_m1]EKD15692.1 hypothetical protein MBM_06320 [Drepanopeziza brunnea f. sp. 'multigermtubi' MB_m1]
MLNASFDAFNSCETKERGGKAEGLEGGLEGGLKGGSKGGSEGGLEEDCSKGGGGGPPNRLPLGQCIEIKATIANENREIADDEGQREDGTTYEGNGADTEILEIEFLASKKRKRLTRPSPAEVDLEAIGLRGYT